MTRFDDPLRDRLSGHLARHDRTSVDDLALRRAAVVVAIVPDAAGQACFLLTRRQARLRAHAGQWALPGGKIDVGESAEASALRELSEEVGLGDATVLGQLDDYPTRSGYCITPVVAWSSSCDHLVANDAEVVEIHRIPIRELDRPDSPRYLSDVADAAGPVIQLPLGERRVHAPTGAILYQFREVGMWGRTTRVAHFDEPHFARR